MKLRSRGVSFFVIHYQVGVRQRFELKKRKKTMGTIYRHNLTKEEIKKLSKMIPGRTINNKHDYEKRTEDDIKLADLYRLYNLRGKEKQAQYYFNKIEDDILKYLLKGKDLK
jgi:hypothetical protein